MFGIDGAIFRRVLGPVRVSGRLGVAVVLVGATVAA